MVRDMGIKVEFNPDLALRHVSEFKAGRRRLEECIPERLEKGRVYEFLKEGQRNFWIEGELPLRETKGNQVLSRPLASVIILDVTHFRLDGKPWTRGRFKVMEVLNPESTKAYFEGYEKLRQ
jgi:hypothetical protein